MLFSLITTLALVIAASAAPAVDPSKPKGNAWADVTQCVYSIGLGRPTGDPKNAFRWDPSIYYIGTIMRYNTDFGWNGTIYSDLARVDTASRWDDSFKTHTAYINGADYTFVGTWQPTVYYPQPELTIWGPNTADLAGKVHFKTSQPNTKVEAKESGDNAGFELCNTKWPISYLEKFYKAPPGGVVGYSYCTTKWDGTPIPGCDAFRSQTWSYYNLPSRL